MKKFFSPAPVWQQEGLTFIRLILGAFMIYHGWEVFDEVKMKEYANWDSFKGFGSATFIVYAGKVAELLGGIFLFLGLFTRLGALLTIATMIYISCFLGNAKVWSNDQHPFMFVLLAMVFLFTGPGKASLDSVLFKK